MTAREINSLIKSSAACGLNVYAKTEYSIVTESGTRITGAKTVDGVIKVRALRSGQWVEFLGNVYVQ